MHEQAVMRDLLARVLELAQVERASSVTRIDVRLGALSHFTPEHFLEHFEDAAHGTLAAGATVHAVASYDATEPEAVGVVLESVELEVPD